VVVICDAAQSTAVSSLGWLDRGSLSIWDINRDLVRTELLDAESHHLVLIEGDEDFFSVLHARDGKGYAVSVHHLSAPTSVLAQATVRNGSARLEGDQSVWASVSSVYGGDDREPDSNAPYTVLLIAPGGTTCEVQRLAWLNDSTYDLLYQGMLRPVAVPNTSSVLVPVQRSSRLVVYEPSRREQVGEIELSGYPGNPALFFRSAGELWAHNYDTLMRLDAAEWRKLDELQLQPPGDSPRKFIGRWSFNRPRTACVVSRPFSGDALLLDAEGFAVTHRAQLSSKPIEAVALDDGRVLARDWKTGQALQGHLQAV
jgi:hypothetical protein